MYLGSSWGALKKVNQASMKSVLLFQISMSVPKKHTTVMLMLFVTTPWDPITAHAKTDFVEME